MSSEGKPVGAMEREGMPVIKTQVIHPRGGQSGSGYWPQADERSRAPEVSVGALGRMNHAEELTAAGLYERYLEAVSRYVLRRAPGVEEAEDITAEVFAAAAVGLPRFRGHCSPYTWLISIAR